MDIGVYEFVFMVLLLAILLIYIRFQSKKEDDEKFSKCFRSFDYNFGSKIEKKEKKVRKKIKKKIENQNVGGAFIEYIKFFLLVNIILLLAILTIHESGHVVVGSLLGCSGGKAIVLDTELGAHADIDCPAYLMNYELVAGPLSLFLFSLLFILFKNSLRYFFYITNGTALYTGFEDFMRMSTPFYVCYVLASIGILLIIYGEYKFVSSFT